MGFRFRRRLRVMPGLWLNLSKSGVSTSIGRRGLTLNPSQKGAQTTIGLPGTGLSYRSRRAPLGTGAGGTADGAGPSAWPAVAVLLALAAVFLWAVLG